MFNTRVGGSALTIIPADCGNDAAAAKKWGSKMLRTLLATVAMTAVVLTIAPASAAKIHSGCTGANLEKTETAVEAMPDADANKMPAFKEIADAQGAMLSGKMGACAMHLGHAMHASMMK